MTGSTSPEAVFAALEPVAASDQEASRIVSAINAEASSRKLSITLKQDPWLTERRAQQKAAFTTMLRLRFGASGVAYDPGLQEVADQAQTQIDELEATETILQAETFEQGQARYGERARETGQSIIDLSRADMASLANQKQRLIVTAGRAGRLLSQFRVLPETALISAPRRIGLEMFIRRERDANSTILSDALVEPHALSNEAYAKIAAAVRARYGNTLPEDAVSERIAYLLLESDASWTVDALTVAIYGNNSDTSKKNLQSLLSTAMRMPTPATDTLNFFERQLRQAVVPNPGTGVNQLNQIVAYRAIPRIASE